MRSTAQTEPKATRALMQRLAARLPQPLDVTKHADQFTSGIPDVTVAWQGFTTWLECKMLKPGKSLDSELGDDQLLYCRRLEGATNGRCWILAWNLRDRAAPATQIYAPSLVVKMRREGLAHPAIVARFGDETPGAWLARGLRSGFHEVPGVDHGAIAELVLATHRFGWDKHR